MFTAKYLDNDVAISSKRFLGIICEEALEEGQLTGAVYIADENPPESQTDAGAFSEAAGLFRQGAGNAGTHDA